MLKKVYDDYESIIIDLPNEDLVKLVQLKPGGIHCAADNTIVCNIDSVELVWNEGKDKPAVWYNVHVILDKKHPESVYRKFSALEKEFVELKSKKKK